MATTLSWRACPSGPHLPLIAGATGAHQPNRFVSAPDQGVDHGSGGPLGPTVGDQPNTYMYVMCSEEAGVPVLAGVPVSTKPALP